MNSMPEMDTTVMDKARPVHDIRESCLRPIFTAMAICGCYCRQYKGSLKCKALVAYRVIIFLVNILFLAKCIVSFRTLDRKHFAGITFQLLFGLTGFCNFLIGLKSTSRYFGHLHKAMDDWSENIIPKLIRFGPGYCKTDFQRRQKILLSFAAVVIIVLMAYHIAKIPLGSMFAALEPEYMTAPLKPSVLTHILMAILFFVQMLMYIVPVVYVITLAMMIRMHFRDFHVYLREQICENSCRIPASFQDLRILHNNLCGLVANLDKDMGYFYGNMFFWNMCTALLCLYMIVKDKMDVVIMIVYIYFLVMSIASIFLISIFAAYVHEGAHAPLDTIYDICVSDVQFEKLAQIDLFLSKLTGTQVGFSTCGLLVITKEFILSIAGVFLTYFAVLYTL